MEGREIIMDKLYSVDVLIPVYNQRDFIIRALESVPAIPGVSIIVCDDGSTDDTLAKIREFASRSQVPMTTIISSQNRGVAHTMNLLYDSARADYVVALGSDDYLTDKFINAINELDGSDLVYFNLETNEGEVFDLNPDTVYSYCGSTKFIRREFLGTSRCPGLKAGEDLELFNELKTKNPTEKFTGIIAKHYNFPREGSLSWQLREGVIEKGEKWSPEVK